jgi:fatty acid synthase subunit beta, fungi type
MDMTIQAADDDGKIVSKRLFETIDETSQSYTYRAPEGLLFATQFTQPALTLLEMAQLRDMESKGLVSSTCNYAGHSLGEFPAIAAFANIMTIEQLIAVVFFRGLAMQVAVKRDETGASNFSMCAINPSRVSRHFSERALVYVVEQIVKETGMLLEIVNHNISDRQYVCAGELRALDCLAATLSYAVTHPEVDFQWLSPQPPSSDDEEKFLAAIHPLVAAAVSKPNPIVLKRGLGFVPLAGIDVPFHSTLLRPGVDSFRSFLQGQISKANTKPETLVDRWIPNLVGRPFSLEREYFERVFHITNSAAIGDILLNWGTVGKGVVAS